MAELKILSADNKFDENRAGLVMEVSLTTAGCD
jgi:hypothetical protein